jgi:hypothetical protein
MANIRFLEIFFTLIVQILLVVGQNLKIGKIGEGLKCR